MFTKLTIRGVGGSVVWGGYRTAVRLKTWAITRQGKGWTLRGVQAASPDGFVSKQTPLLFTAPRPQGYWLWPVESIRYENNQVVASLGQPQQ